MDAVAAGLGSDVDDGVANAGGLSVEDFLLFADAEGKDIDQRVGGVTVFENGFAADGGYAEAVAVVGNAFDDAVQDAEVMRGGGRPEAEGVHYGDGARAHREDVAQDSADAGGRALEGFDVAGVVVRFDLERHDPLFAVRPLANADDAGVFARSLEDVFAVGGELPEMDARAFVRAVFAPHDLENAQFGGAGLAAEEVDDFLVFVLGDYHFAAPTASSRDWKMPSPSVEPMSGSQASSGWGIIPMTLRPALRMPAMLRAEPLGLST